MDYIKQFEEEEERHKEDERRAKEDFERRLREENKAKEVRGKLSHSQPIITERHVTRLSQSEHAISPEVACVI